MSHHHHEHHNESSESLRDFVIGMADGLTVPFALVAGLSGAVDSTNLIITAGVAEIAAGCIAMGLGGYMGAKTESEHYASEYARELYEIKELTHVEEKETRDILVDFGVAEEHAPLIIDGLKKDPKKWADFMMRFELGLERPDPRRLYQSPLIIGGAYAAGGIVPLAPYILMEHVHEALPISVLVSLIALFAFGAFKGKFTGQHPLKTAFSTTLIGAAAAGAAFVIARLVGA
jgi:vacuolar iron transporter family protein